MIPRKLQKGQLFKAATVDKVNEIIDYLKTQQIVGDGKTIKVSQLTSGVGLTVLQNGSSQSSAAAPFDHLYKLGLQTEGQTNYLTVQSLKSHTSGDNHYQKKLDLAAITEDGRYRVKCYMTQYPQRGLFDNGWTIYITPSAFHTGQGNEPNLRGIFTFQLGEIQRITTTITDEQTGQETEVIEYEILSQDTVGWVQYQDSLPDTAFAVYAQFVTPPQDGDFISEAFTLADFKFFVNAGEVYFGDSAKAIGGIFLDTPEGENLSKIYINLAVDETTHSCTLTAEKDRKNFVEDGIKNYTIAMIEANPYGYSDAYWVIHQYIGTNVYFNYDNKVGVSQGDPEPSYLLDKLTSEDGSISINSFTDDQGYMLVNLESNITVSGGKNCSVTRDGNDFTVDVQDSGVSSISGANPIQVTGNSQNGYVISLDKSSFVETINGDAYITVQHPANTTTRNLTLNVGAVLGHLIAGNGITITNSGNNYTITCTAAGLTVGSSARAVLAIDSTANPPELKASANIPTDISIICGYQGNLTYWNAQGYKAYSMPVLSREATTFKWMQGGYCSVSSSDPDPGYLQDKVKVAGNLSNVFTFESYSDELRLSLSNTPTISILPVVSYSGGSAIWSDAAVVSVNSSDNAPSYLEDKLTSEDGSVTFTAKDGKLDLSSGGGKVKVSENDPEAGWLYDKIFSTNLSIKRDVLDGAFEQVDLTINPEYFISSDGSIDIQQSDDGISLDFISNGMVKCSQNDVTNYLQSKLQSSKMHLLFETKSNGVAETIDMNISVNAFTSSDESVTISEAATGQIDLTGAGKVQCTEADTADYLNTKINVDPSIAALITLDKQENQILIKSALTGSGVLLVENGIVKALPAPSGKAVLAVDNGVFVWMPYSDCENACQSE